MASKYPKLDRHISHSFYRLTDAEAGRLAKGVGKKLPRPGSELKVEVREEVTGWLTRTPMGYGADAPKRGWVWAVHGMQKRAAGPEHLQAVFATDYVPEQEETKREAERSRRASRHVAGGNPVTKKEGRDYELAKKREAFDKAEEKLNVAKSEKGAAKYLSAMQAQYNAYLKLAGEYSSATDSMQKALGNAGRRVSNLRDKWHVSGHSRREGKFLGMFPSKAEARRHVRDWLKAHPPEYELQVVNLHEHKGTRDVLREQWNAMRHAKGRLVWIGGEWSEKRKATALGHKPVPQIMGAVPAGVSLTEFHAKHKRGDNPKTTSLERRAAAAKTDPAIIRAFLKEQSAEGKNLRSTGDALIRLKTMSTIATWGSHVLGRGGMAESELRIPRYTVEGSMPFLAKLTAAIERGKSNVRVNEEGYGVYTLGPVSRKAGRAVGVEKHRSGDNPKTRATSDKKVIKAFTEKRAEMSKKLISDGDKLTGSGFLGGGTIAQWRDGKIHFIDMGTKSAEKTQHAVIREAPILDIAGDSTWAGGSAFQKRWAAAEARRLERKGSTHKSGGNPSTIAFRNGGEPSRPDVRGASEFLIGAGDTTGTLSASGKRLLQGMYGVGPEHYGAVDAAIVMTKHREGRNPRTTAQGAKCGVRVGKLDAAERRRIPRKLFGLPKTLDYPMPDSSHAVTAKGRAKTALEDGHITRAQYHQIVRKADKILAECGGAPKRKPKRKKQKKRGAKRKGRATLAKSETTADIRLKARMRGLIGRA